MANDPPEYTRWKLLFSSAGGVFWGVFFAVDYLEDPYRPHAVFTLAESLGLFGFATYLYLQAKRIKRNQK
jgi:hypothetical protein